MWFVYLLDYIEDKTLSSYSEGFPFIFSAVLGSNCSILNTVIDMTSDINVKDDIDEWTALHESVNCEKNDMTKVLLKRGIDYNIKNKMGMTVLELALKNNFKESVRIIEDHTLKEEMIIIDKSSEKNNRSTLKL